MYDKAQVQVFLKTEFRFPRRVEKFALHRVQTHWEGSDKSFMQALHWDVNSLANVN